MACDRKTLLLLSCYADGEATPEESTRAAEHIETCAECRKLVEEWQGQRQLLEWACTFELPDEVGLTIPEREGRVAIAESALRRQSWVRWRWSWTSVSIAAAVLIVGLVAHHFATLPPILSVGKAVVAGAQPEEVRVGSGVTLRVGPNSKIIRVSDRSVKLEKGSVAAWVEHGTGFEVVTPRIRVLDQGTEFFVGTGPEIDCVSVQEGGVSVEKNGSTHNVEAGQVLVVRGNEEPSVVSPLAPKEDSQDKGTLISDSYGGDEPIGAQELDWREGLQRLSKRFPDARIAGGCGSGSNTDSKRITRFGLDGVPGLRKAFRAHFAQIAQALAGGTVDGEWEMPVGFLHVDGIAGPPQLPEGVYYIRLVCGDGRIVWRLSGADGEDADFPVVFASPESVSAGHGGSGGGGTQTLQYAYNTRGSTSRFAVLVGDWPGKYKPALDIKVLSVPVSDALRNDKPLLDDVAAQTAGVNGLRLDYSTPHVGYFDPARRHRLILMWNGDVGEQMKRAIGLSKRGKGATILMGVVATDVAWIDPALPAGVYLIWWVLPSASDKPHWEISTPDMANRFVLAGDPQGVPRKGQPGYDPHQSIPGGNNTWGLEDEVSLRLSNGIVGKSFRFGFIAVRGYGQGVHWGEGWVLVKKP